jgi:hypothetical protein
MIMEWKLNLRLVARYENHFVARLKLREREPIGTCNTHFFSRIKFCANRSAYKNAYKIIVYMKTFQKNKSCIGCIAWHGILYFSKILEEPRRI